MRKLGFLLTFLLGCNCDTTPAAAPVTTVTSSETHCVAGDRRCNQLEIEVCDAGSWLPFKTCPFICFSGDCLGSCSPNTSRCNQLDVEVCDAEGEWDYEESCPFVCLEGACKGVCVPGETQGPKTCNERGEWH